MKRLVAAILLALGSTASAGADEPFQCALKEAGGVSAAEAGTAVGLICDDLRRESGGRGRLRRSAWASWGPWST